jgi:FkbM family methyltransferase
LTQVAYFPVVEDEDQLIDLLSRAGWFLTFSPIDKIYVFVADPELADTAWRVAPGMDPNIAQRFDALRQLVHFVPASRAADVIPVIEQVAVVLRWRKDASPEWLPEATLSSMLANKRVFEVDADAVRHEGGNYIDVSYKLGPRIADLGDDNRNRFAEVARQLGHRERAVVLATGPSVSAYDRFDYDGALGIVCNTVILDEGLMETVKPKFAVFLDPIFHFGPSQYAARFRENLKRAAERFEFTICIPVKYHAVFASAVPELIDRTIAIPFRKEREFNFDLASEFEVRTTANVLTFVMLPLATTFARTVSILGCDGRLLDEDKYFWRHSPTTQLNDEMANIQGVHPGFFKLDYNDYYLEHCQTLDEQLTAGERAGYRFETLAESHIPALKERVAATQRAAAAPTDHRLGLARNGSRPPRLLVIDSTRVGGESATGQLKRNFLIGWPDGAFLQISTHGNRYVVARSLDDSSTDVPVLAEDAVLDQVASFRPEVIYYRPTIDQHPHLHSLALNVLARHPVPLVTHIMDDWPRRLEAHDEERARNVDQDLRQLLSQSDQALSISDKMSAVFGARYGVTFEAIANGVDPAIYRAASGAAALEKSGRKEVVLRYCGALAKDMTFHTVVDVARAVDALQGELPMRFEVYTMPPWRRPFEEAVAGLRGITISDAVFGDAFPSLLAEADALVLAYNFDQDSLRYIRFSMPNKLPEYLSSGAAVLAVGPREANGIDYVLSRDLGCCVTDRDPGKLAEALRRLGTDADYRNELAQKAQAWAVENLDLGHTSKRFQTILRKTADRAAKRIPLLGPYSRDQQARIDEAEAIARLVAPLERGGVILDVGAHHGSSLKHFAEAGWTVLACEPDSANRAQLVEHFGSRTNVSIDPRAVSDKPAQDAPLFSSAQSSGISSLHAFHETHREAETVDVTTVAELVDAYALPRIDFLKIDVEGLDWNVLKGVPWSRIKPEVIECEFEDAKTLAHGYTYRDVADDLVARGYTVYLSEWHPIVRYGLPHEWRQLVRYPTPLSSSDAWGNILALRKDLGSNAVSAAFEACLRVENPSTVKLDGHGTAVATGVGTPAGSEGEIGDDARAGMPTGLSRYERLYLWASARNPAIFSLGRLVAWCGRKARRYPALTAAYLALLAGLVVAGFISALSPYAPLLWLTAGALVAAGVVSVVTGFASFLIKETRHELQLQQLSGRGRLERAETVIRSGVQAREGLEAKIGALEREQRAAREALEARANTLEGEQRALEARVSELLSTQKPIEDALEAELKELAAKHVTTRDALEREQRAATEALEAKVGELLSGQKSIKDALVGGVDELAAAQKQALRHVSLRIAQSNARSADFDGLVLLIAPERSGSTWLLDLLRCHPAAVFLPTMDVFRQLGARGRRYPIHLSDGPGATLDIEAQEGLGASTPAFTLRDVHIRPSRRLAVEKIHPSAIRFDVPGFLDRLGAIKGVKRKHIRCCYLARDPVDSIRSFLAYKDREPDWGVDAPVSSAPELYLRSFEALRELVSERPGPVIRYEELVADPIQIISRVYRWLWPKIDWPTLVSVASQATDMTRRDRRKDSQTGRFLGQSDDAVPSDISLLLGLGDELPEGSHRAIEKCRRLRAEIIKLGVELPLVSVIDRR